MKRIFYVHFLPHAEYSRIVSARPDVELTRLERGSSAEEMLPVIAQAHAYQIGAARGELAPYQMADDWLLSRAPNLLIVSSSGAGYDPVDVDACTQHGVLVVNQAGGNKEAVAEHALGMILCLSKRVVETDHIMRRQAGIERNKFLGRDIHGKTIGIVGLGNVGRRLAELCQGLFAMRVVGYDPYVASEAMRSLGVEKVELDQLLATADYVSVNCPLSRETRGMIGAREFALMRPHAYFVTTARGGIHDEDALAQGLRDKRIAGAGLDVWADEPPPPDHPLLQFDNVLVSPHTAGVTEDARANMGRIAAENLLAALDGRKPERIINPEVWPRYQTRYEEIFGVRPQ